MHALCNYLVARDDIVSDAIQFILIANNLHTSAGDFAGLFTAFARGKNFEPVGKFALGGENMPGIKPVVITGRFVVVLGSDFANWSELRDLIDRFGAISNVDIVILAPTNSDPMSQAALAQFATEQAIRLQAYGFTNSLRVAHECDRQDLAPITLGRLQPATMLGTLLEDLSPDKGDRAAILTLNGQPSSASIIATSDPMFTVLTRTQGTRMETLSEVFLNLSAQTIGDFEHLVIAHNAQPDATAEIRQLIEDQSKWLRERIRFEEVHGGTRTTPLNVGFAMAKGKYIIILDDDDIVFANWLETFQKLARLRPGALLRAVAMRQEFTWAQVEGKRAARAVGAMLREYAATFDYLDHLEVSQTPPVSIAFPRFLFANHGMHFDETLTTTEDWDYIMRCAARVGVASTDEITCIYRWWVNAGSSRTEHAQAEWGLNHAFILDKIDASVNLFGPGTTRRYREIVEKMNEYLRWANKMHHDLLDIQAVTEASDVEHTKEKIRELSRNAQGELSAILRDGPGDLKLHLAPEVDMLPPPKLNRWQKLLAKPDTLARMRTKQRCATIEASGIFDGDWYLSTYSDVAKQGVDPLAHFVQFGSRELRSPSAQFNARAYYAAHADLRDQRIEPVFHFLLYGKREGRRYESHF